MVQVPTIPLSNGRKLPLLGLGTWLASNEQQLNTAIRAALDAGYRYIDTAELYKNEHVIGSVVKEYIDAGKFKREDIYITTKLPLYGHDNAAFYIEQSLKKLQVDYIDLYLIHNSIPLEINDEKTDFKLVNGEPIPITSIPYIETWKILEKYYNEGKLKAIGVSNFNEEQLQDLYNKATVKPQNIQVECHILFPQKSLHALCKKLDVTLTAYAPIGSPGRGEAQKGESFVQGDSMSHPLVKRLAEKYHKTPAQILIRQLIQRGISTIPKSTNPNRVRENFNVLDFELTVDEMAEFDKIPGDNRLFLFDFAKNHPWHPFKADLKKVLGYEQAV
uniref:Aldo_ket_red domain-containing protein n=1 Tax=Panagrellus redivivus TaxID=6233 RepID=A0A7E4VDR1_PANRE